MTPADAKLIADLEAAEARATKGRWEADTCDSYCPVRSYSDDGESELIADFDSGLCDDAEVRANAEFVALARNTLPQLLALVKAQDAALRAIANGNHDYGLGGSCTVFCAGCRAAKALAHPFTERRHSDYCKGDPCSCPPEVREREDKRRAADPLLRAVDAVGEVRP